MVKYYQYLDVLFPCTKCGKEFRRPPQKIGTLLECGRCGTVRRVPRITMEVSEVDILSLGRMKDLLRQLQWWLISEVVFLAAFVSIAFLTAEQGYPFLIVLFVVTMLVAVAVMPILMAIVGSRCCSYLPPRRIGLFAAYICGFLPFLIVLGRVYGDFSKRVAYIEAAAAKNEIPAGQPPAAAEK